MMLDAVPAWLAAALAVVLGAILGWVFQPAIIARRQLLGAPDPCEAAFSDPVTGLTHPFPSIERDPPTLTLTVVVPAYNEEERLHLMLDPALAFFERKRLQDPRFSFEILVVDDGSHDLTSAVALSYSLKHGADTVRLMSLRPNQGKGAAIRKGMFAGRGSLLLMCDADGATEIECYDRLEAALLKCAVAPTPPLTGLPATPASGATSGVKGSASAAVVALPAGALGASLGSRAHLEKESTAQRALYRTVLMKGMHLCVAVLCSSKIHDTQCGFKLFTRDAAKVLFGALHLERWAFDIEVVQLALRHKVPLAEVPVVWHEVDGSKLITSKLDVVTASLAMLRDMLCVKLCYALHIWSQEPRAPLPPQAPQTNARKRD